jgi:tRNA A-37 threonylcarbamoyl transferase component Bud32
MHDQGYNRQSHLGWSIDIHPEVATDEAYKLLSPDRRIRLDKNIYRQVVSSGSARVFFSSFCLKNKPVGVYIKHYLFRSSMDFFKHLFRSSRGKRAFNASLMLRQNKFNAPEPLVLMQKKIGPFFTQSLLVSKEAPCSVNLSVYLKDMTNEHHESLPGLKRQLLVQFGSTIGRMHSKGIIHGDLRLSNVLAQRCGDKTLFWFIDNERTRQFKSAPLRLVRKNLVQINMFRTNISNTDRMRFIKAYAHERGLSREEIRKIARLVIDRTSLRLARKHGKTS